MSSIAVRQESEPTHPTVGPRGAMRLAHAPALKVGAADLRTPSATRAFVREAIRSWGVAELAADLELGVSELVTNAVVHGAAPITVQLHHQLSGAVLCEVSDSSWWAPQAYEPGPELSEAEHGRGLGVVAGLASVFGARPGGCHGERTGKTVWFCVEPPAGAEAEGS
jgi:anti-sigma regulatory factor (Ser/Thr protein kinase)